MIPLTMKTVTVLALCLVLHNVVRNDSPHDLSYDPDPRCNLKTAQYEVVACWPHRTDAYTEGLEIHNGFLYESTGGDKSFLPLSNLRRVGLRTVTVLENITLDENYIAEGLTILGGQVFQLTKDSGLALIYKLNKLSDPAKKLNYNGWSKGWGITNDASNLIVSDATPNLHYVDPASFKIKHSIPVHYKNGCPQGELNELEYFKNSIYANVHDLDYVVRINPVN